MKKIISMMLALVMVFCQIAPVLGATSDSVGTDLEVCTEEKVYANATLAHKFVENGVFVVLSNKASLEFKRFQAADFPEIGCTAVTDFSSVSGARIKKQVEMLSKKSTTTRELLSVDKEKIQSYNQVLYLRIENPGKQNVLDAIDQLMLREDVIYAGPNYIYSVVLESTAVGFPQNEAAYDNLQLWDAWEITTGVPSIRVGVVDTGIDATHPDLAGKVDISLSARFQQIEGSGENIDLEDNELIFGQDNLPDVLITIGVTEDSKQHGTHVAGTIIAQGNNTQGVKGVASGVTLVSLDVVPTGGPTTSAMLIAAAQYAEDNNIHLLNCSFGVMLEKDTDDESSEEDEGDELSEEDVNDHPLKKAWEGYNGLIVCAAGNSGHSNDLCPDYPSCFDIDNLISVGASTEDDTKYANSNYGKTTVDLFAPGVNINSTMTNERYVLLSGTSYAAPFVTGAAALIWSLCPNMTPVQVKQAIMNSVDSASELQEYCVTGGRLNVYRAIISVQSPGMYVPQGNTHHLVYCNCGEQHLIPHKWNYSPQNTTLHLVYCVCGEQHVEAHSWSYTSQSATSHLVNCVCGQQRTELHTWNYTSLNATSHQVSCVCGQQRAELHTWNYTSLNATSHRVSCVCGGQRVEAHSWSYTSQNATSHTVSCVCGEQRVEVHSWSYTPQSATSHLANCACGEQRVEAHSWSYTSQNSTSHLVYCVCGEQHIESHTWSYLAQGLTSHLVYCVCGNQRTESHSWLEMGTKYRCGMCGYITNAIPGIIRKLDDEEQGSQEYLHP